MKRSKPRRSRSSPPIELLEKRYLLAGLAADSTFAASHGYSAALVVDLSPNDVSYDDPVDLCLQPDGKSLVLAKQYGSVIPTWAVLRISTSGDLDTSFGVGGIVKFSTVSGVSPGCMALQQDGRVIVGGDGDTPVGTITKRPPILVRYTPSGAIDTTFGSAGTTTLPEPNANFYDMAILADGKILVCGRSQAPAPSRSFYFGTFWRFQSDGSLDTTFGVGGKLQYDEQVGDQWINNLQILSDGKILAETPTGLRRFTASGFFDGLYITKVGPFARQSDGHIIVAEFILDGTTDIYVWRYSANGVLDPSFGTSGSTRINIEEYDTPKQLLVTPDDKIIVAARVGNHNGLDQDTHTGWARLNSNGSLDTGFGLNGRLIDTLRATTFTPINIDDEPWQLAMAPGNVMYELGVTDAETLEDHGNINGGDNLMLRKYVLDAPIDVRPGGPYGPVLEGSAFTVQDGGSTYASGSIVSYEWSDIDDQPVFKAQATGATSTLISGDDPTDEVALRLTTSDGLIAYASTAMVVQNQPPTVQLTLPSIAPVGKPVLIHGVVTDAVYDTLQATLDFGDQSPPGTFGSDYYTNMLLDLPVNHTYNATGTYSLSLSSIDGDGGSASVSASINIANIVAQEFVDADNDGIRDNNENPLTGVQVYIDQNNDGTFEIGEPTGVSGADGLVGFSGLAPGVYRLRAAPPPGWNYTVPAAGYVDLTVTASTGAATFFALTSLPVISGGVWNDADGDGIREQNEVGLANRVIFADLNDDGFAGVGEGYAITDSTGSYRLPVPASFDGQPVVIRNYANGAGSTQTSPTGDAGLEIVVFSGQLCVAPDFGIRLATGGTISGTVFNDLNADGMQGFDEPTLTATVFLDLDNDGARDPTEPVGSSGTVAGYFRNLSPGTYMVRLLPPTGFAQNLPADGQGQTAVITGGNTVTGLDFGLHDVVPPTLLQASFQYDNPARAQLSLLFSEPVTILDYAQITIENLAGGTWSVDWWSLSGNTMNIWPVFHGTLPDGNYRLVAMPGSLGDLSGNQVADPISFDFFTLGADANHDRKVDTSDLNQLAMNWNGSGKVFSQGDFNYDGKVDNADLMILASHWQMSLAPPPPALPAARPGLRRTAIRPVSLLQT